MKTYKLNKKDKELIEIARQVISKNYRDDSAISSTVGSALITDSGKIYRGINIHSNSSGPTSICSETAAIAQMVSEGGKKVNTIASVSGVKGKKGYVLQSCGSCRHIISQFGNPFVIISKNKKTKLIDLYPLPVKS